MIFEKTIVGIYKKNICARFDGNPLLSYFSVADFDGLQRTPFDFLGNNGQKLQGYFYYYADPRKDRLIVFDHGMGGGHDSYLKEIEAIARRGYTVFSYDHTGCKESEGESIVGFAQSLCDLDHAINALHSVKEYGDAKFTVIGHSWGGFAALNVPALHPEIESCVSISGFIGVEQMINQLFPGALRFYRPSVLALERETNPMYSLFDARGSLKGTKTRVLCVISDDDPTVNAKYHFDALREELKESGNIRFFRLHGRMHNPNYTPEAVAELTKMTQAMTAGIKKNSFKTPEDAESFRASWDWNAMTEQDEAFWDLVLGYIES